MAEYRDYGAVGNATAPLVEVDTIRRTQVYQATHDGDQRLPLMKRSFISFSFDDKPIEDFNLLAIIENNALQRKLYADFEDNTSESDVWDGQIYWSSHYKANTLELTLFTDGITENQLDEFKAFFSPGKIGELVLAEHPNRAILARVSEAPEYSILPFEEKITVKIAGRDYQTSTTLYKGRINLSFVMDDPFWYSRANLLGVSENPNEQGLWEDSNGNMVHLLHDKDVLKIIQEDGVPCIDMLQDLSDQQLISTNAPPHALVTDNSLIDSDDMYTPVSIILGDQKVPVLDESYDEIASRINYSETNIGHLIYYVRDINYSFQINSQQPIYFFYAGNAPCAPTFTFSLIPSLDSNGFISFPKNKYTDSENPYNTITIECLKKQEFHFTTPSIYTGYNQIIEIFKSPKMLNVAWEDVRIAINTLVKHWAPREYANYIINQISSGGSIYTNNSDLNQCVIAMQDFLKNSSNEIKSTFFIVDCKTGKAFGKFICRDRNNQEMSLLENVGDMVQSKYLVINEKNTFDENGYISFWEQGKTYSYKMYSDCELTDVSLKYKYYYL